MDLFSQQRESNRQRVAPLAVRMRPRTLDEFVGQQHFAGAGRLLRRTLEADRLSSMVFFGPPGCGKTIAGTTGLKGPIRQIVVARSLLAATLLNRAGLAGSAHSIGISIRD